MLGDPDRGSTLEAVITRLRTIAQSELRAALSSSERAYEEAASLQVEAVVIEYLLRQIGEQQRGGTA